MAILEINTGKHTKGNCKCDECWQNYPVRCTCGGLIHAEYLGGSGKSNSNPMGIKCLCDKCDTRFLKAENKQEPRKNKFYKKN